MSKRLTIEEFHNLAKKRGGICLSNTYVNNRTSLLWECKYGHQWKATPKNIRRGAWCHICGGSYKLTIDDIRQIAIERGGKCLSNNYTNNQTKLLWECAEGHRWEAIPASVKAGRWCPKCAKKRTALALKLDIGDMELLAKTKRGRCLSKNYVNAHTKLLWECEHGHHWEATPNDIQQGSWCPFCLGHRKTIKDMKQLAKERGGKCLSNAYITTKGKLLWECGKSHRWRATPSTVIRGSWCPLCAGRGKTIKDMKKLAKQRGGRCLSNAYITTETKLLWECSEKHQWRTTPEKIISGEWCPQCSSGLGERICREFFEQMFQNKFPKSYPKWLINKDGNQMELDGYCETLRIAFEHQGEQHYSAGTHFITTQKRLRQRQENDKLKAKLCKQQGVSLIIIPEIMGRLPIRRVRQYLRAECIRSSIPLPKHFEKKSIDLKKAYATCREREALNELRAIAKRRNGKCLSEIYLGNSTHLLWECQKGHRWEATPSNVKNNGSWCPFCAHNPRLNIEDMRKLAREQGGRCLSDTYTNQTKKLLWECSAKHRWKATPLNIRRGKWCPICGRRRHML